MKKSKEILSSVLKTTQMGQIGIRSALGTPLSEEIQSALQTQLQEYDRIERDAHMIANQRGWKVKELNPSVRFMTDRMTHMRMSGKSNTTKIAEMMIMGSTKGLIQGMKHNHPYLGQDEAVAGLSQKLVDTEHANIKEMEKFL